LRTRILRASPTALAVLGALFILLPMPTFTLWKVHYAALELSLLLGALGLLGAALSRGAWGLVGLASAMVAIWPAAQGLALAHARGDAFSPLAWLGYDPQPTLEVQRDLSLDPGRPDLLLDRYPGLGEGPRPWVMVLHGGSWLHGDKGEASAMSRWLAANGYTVFDAHYRLSDEAPFPAGVADVECLLGRVAAAAVQLGVDPTHGALLGRSAGGHMALLIADSAGDGTIPPACDVPALRPSKVIALYPAADLAWGWENVASPDLIGVHHVQGLYLGGSPQEHPDTYALATPMTHLDPADPPALVLHGLADRLVSPHHSVTYAGAAAAARVPVTLVTIPGAEHGYDVRHGGIAEQITRAEILRFLAGDQRVESGPVAP